jgi:Phosphotransferase system, mannose/fructose/N-acetylgalactosamine-specific component IIB
MIKLVRLDERMIHGQVAIKWSRVIGVNRIIVVNDDAANNVVIKKSLMMAAPQTVKVAIKGVEDSVALLNDPRMETVSVLVIVARLDDLLEIVQRVNGIPKINIGNYGRLATQLGTDERKSFGHHLYADSYEIELFRKIISYSILTVFQITPDDVATPLSEILGI